MHVTKPSERTTGSWPPVHFLPPCVCVNRLCRRYQSRCRGQWFRETFGGLTSYLLLHVFGAGPLQCRQLTLRCPFFFSLSPPTPFNEHFTGLGSWVPPTGRHQHPLLGGDPPARPSPMAGQSSYPDGLPAQSHLLCVLTVKIWEMWGSEVTGGGRKNRKTHRGSACAVISHLTRKKVTVTHRRNSCTAMSET